jgi:hypothetical protein
VARRTCQDRVQCINRFAARRIAMRAVAEDALPFVCFWIAFGSAVPKLSGGEGGSDETDLPVSCWADRVRNGGCNAPCDADGRLRIRPYYLLTPLRLSRRTRRGVAGDAAERKQSANPQIEACTRLEEPS